MNFIELSILNRFLKNILYLAVSRFHQTFSQIFKRLWLFQGILSLLIIFQGAHWKIRCFTERRRKQKKKQSSKRHKKNMNRGEVGFFVRSLTEQKETASGRIVGEIN